MGTRVSVGPRLVGQVDQLGTVLGPKPPTPLRPVSAGGRGRRCQPVRDLGSGRRPESAKITPDGELHSLIRRAGWRTDQSSANANRSAERRSQVPEGGTRTRSTHSGRPPRIVELPAMRSRSARRSVPPSISFRTTSASFVILPICRPAGGTNHQDRRVARTASAAGQKSSRDTRWIVERSKVAWTISVARADASPRHAPAPRSVTTSRRTSRARTAPAGSPSAPRHAGSGSAGVGSRAKREPAGPDSVRAASQHESAIAATVPPTPDISGYAPGVPAYEYRCRTCDATFEIRRSLTDYSTATTCPRGHEDGAGLLGGRPRRPCEFAVTGRPPLTCSDCCRGRMLRRGDAAADPGPPWGGGDAAAGRGTCGLCARTRSATPRTGCSLTTRKSPAWKALSAVRPGL